MGETRGEQWWEQWKDNGWKMEGQWGNIAWGEQWEASEGKTRETMGQIKGKREKQRRKPWEVNEENNDMNNEANPEKLMGNNGGNGKQ